MELQPVNLIGGYYAGDNLPWSSQDVLNWIPEQAQEAGTQTPMRLRSAPGLVEFAQLSGPIRGMRDVEGRLLVVAGNTLYQVSTSGVPTVRGEIPGVGLVQMAHNQVTGGNELLIATGSAGYVYNTVSTALSRITDPGYPGSVAVSYIDSYLAQVEPFGRFWFHSDLADAMAYNTLDRYESEVSPDRIVTLATNQSEVVIFSERTIEFFDNTGAAQGTFASKRISIQKGIGGRHTVAALDNSLMWLGNDGVVYRLDGYQAVPISNRAIERAIAANDASQAFAFAYEDQGHKVYYLTFQDGMTWGYDATTGIWHRRASYGMDRWRLNALVFSNTQWIGGDYTNGKLWRVDWDAASEGEAPMVRQCVSGVMQANQNKVLIPYAELLVNAGRAPLDASDHKLTLTYSNDGGYNWSNLRERSIGAQGEYPRRVRFSRLGAMRNRIWKITTASPVPTNLAGAVVYLEGAS